MKKKYLALALSGIMLASVAMGCGSKKTPADNNDSKVTTPAPETSSDEYTLPDETTSYNNEETEEVTKPSEESTEEKEEETTTAAAEDETTEKQTEGSTEKPTEKPTAKPTEAPTVKPTVAPTQPVVKPTEPPTTKPTVAPTQAPTTKPTQAPTQKPTQPPTQKPTEPPTTLAPAICTKVIDGIPYTIDMDKKIAYIELGVIFESTIPDTVHLPYEIDGYVVDYFYHEHTLIGLVTKNLYVDERIEKLWDFITTADEISDNIYWYNSNVENWNPGHEHNIWFDRIGKYCTLHLGVKSTELIVAQGTGFAPGSKDKYFSINELYTTMNRTAGVAYRTFVCTDGTFSFNW